MKALLLTTLLLGACTLAKPAGAPTDEDGNSILFLVLRIRKDTGEAPAAVELLSKTISPGKFKPETPEPGRPENYLTLYLYRNKKVVQTLLLPHPLYRHIEYSAADGSLAAKTVELPDAEFFVRLQLQGDAVVISETLGNRPQRRLTKLKL